MVLSIEGLKRWQQVFVCSGLDVSGNELHILDEGVLALRVTILALVCIGRVLKKIRSHLIVKVSHKFQVIGLGVEDNVSSLLGYQDEQRHCQSTTNENLLQPIALFFQVSCQRNRSRLGVQPS